MKNFLIALLILPLLSCSQKKKELSADSNKEEPTVSEVEKIQESSLVGVYEYVYEHNSGDLVENHYMEFKDNETIYFGTSDDFDEGREGYLPGFFKAKMNDFKKTDDKISFKLSVNDSIFYTKPITPLQQSENVEKWRNALTSEKRQYEGNISGDTIIVKTVDFDPRVFVKIKK
ncbi:hypothetical protein UMM65_15700 [Aureibaculum sp. 2210JD6-5]|uniref:hypothetical protein n=1 Tax=Aureibaculum sp. 2210JD6-5 TaxID=3103957 RepID=UPI002AAC70EC|nr:hypothetical protein [Aureibaculum sp. 2210JD6-5]MDY7396693.1 hypothetical protein [Aureibaculum sp. 2210JD6-5]